MKEKKQKQNRLRKYGLTEELYLTMLRRQSNSCSICSCGLTETTAFVDHNHSTGFTRGLLCRMCNLMIGLAKDDTNRLRNAITYLETHL